MFDAQTSFGFEMPVEQSPASGATQSAKKERSYFGYQQCFIDGEWTFIVTGFESVSSGAVALCSVLKSDGSEAQVAIDEFDRICIRKTWFGRKNWTH